VEWRRTAFAVLAFGIAMGYLEAVVVVYLRAALGAADAPSAAVAPTWTSFEGIEAVRELATLVMIATVGWLAGRSGLERLAWAAVVFGAWDITYYVGLRLTVGWPPSLETWDLLFLVPRPWVGPVWAPVAVSGALIGFGLLAARRMRAGQMRRVEAWQAVAAVAGGGLVILGFLVDADRVAAGDLSPWSGWPFFLAGMAIATVAAASAIRGAVGAHRREG
jgi:hypothetical protein